MIYKQLTGAMGREMGFKVRDLISTIPITMRAEIGPSLLKGEKTLAVDALGERFAIELIAEQLANTDVSARLITNPTTGKFHQIGSGSMFSYCFLDPVDGTLKLTGLNNEPGKLRVINDGQWGFGISFTDITNKSPLELTIEDFKHTAIVDGNYSLRRIHPTNAYTSFYLHESEPLTFEKVESGSTHCVGQSVRLGMSSQRDLSKGFLGFDGFQAFDRKSARPGLEEETVEVYRQIANRNAGGAFDLSRSYGDFSDMLRTLLGYTDLEPQTVGKVSMNNNLPNIISTYWIARAAGGFVTDFEGNDLGRRKLSDGRVNMIYAANKSILDQLVSRLKPFA